jgi:hypothetical protein
MQVNMFKTIVIKKSDTDIKLFKAGDRYLCTAYLPDHEKFAVDSGSGWITFEWSEEEFLNAFHVFKDNKGDVICCDFEIEGYTELWEDLLEEYENNDNNS